MSDTDTARKRLPTRGSLARLFVLGAILLVVPLALVLFQASCTTGCFNSNVSRVIDTIFPYLMLAGGLLIGYGMKKLVDTQREESEYEEKDTDEDEPGRTEKS